MFVEERILLGQILNKYSLYFKKVCTGRLTNERDGFLLGSKVTGGYCEVAAVYWSLVQDRVERWDFCVVSCANVDWLTI